MKKDLLNTSPNPWLTRWPLVALLVFTVFAGVGYASFGRHPELLQHTPQFASFFSVSFTFFAQGHVLLTAIVLILYLSYKTQFKWVSAFAAIYAISLLSELTGTATGLPFGPYSYTELLGPKWFDLVPVLIPLSWFTMALPAFYLANVTFSGQHQNLQRVAFGALLLTLWDLALDPAMSFLTPYWLWEEAGAYYGMPWINLFGWFFTGLILMTALHWLKVGKWMSSLSLSWMIKYYLLVLLLPLLMVIAGLLWLSALLTLASIGLCALFIYKRTRNLHGDLRDEKEPSPDLLETEQLNDYFSYHSRSFSFAARFFSPEQYRLVTRLYAFCRTTDDIADIYAVSHGKEEAEKQLDEWEQRVHLSYQGIPSDIAWLDELMQRSVQSGVPFEIIRDLIAGVRSDLEKVELNTLAELHRYTYCVASVVGIWLCYLFGVREKEVLERASALGRAMQITNIIRDVGEDIRIHRLYLPADLLRRHGVEKDELLAMEAGTLAITEGYKILLEDLMERAEADYNFAFRGLSAIPPSFARAAAVASEIYKGIHRSVRRNRYNNFQRRAYTKWYEKVFLASRALRRLRKTQKRPFIPDNQSLVSTRKAVTSNGRRTSLLSMFTAASLMLQSGLLPSPLAAHQRTDATVPTKFEYLHMNLTKTEVLTQLRTQYLAAIENEPIIEESLSMLAQVKNRTPTMDAYEAAFIVLKAKFAFWPHRKMKYLRDGLPKLDTLIASNPDEIEVRYLRLLSCFYLPRFLGRGDTVKQDLDELALRLPAAQSEFPADLYANMVQFVTTNKAHS